MQSLRRGSDSGRSGKGLHIERVITYADETFAIGFPAPRVGEQPELEIDRETRDRVITKLIVQYVCNVLLASQRHEIGMGNGTERSSVQLSLCHFFRRELDQDVHGFSKRTMIWSSYTGQLLTCELFERSVRDVLLT